MKICSISLISALLHRDTSFTAVSLLMPVLGTTPENSSHLHQAQSLVLPIKSLVLPSIWSRSRSPVFARKSIAQLEDMANHASVSTAESPESRISIWLRIPRFSTVESSVSRISPIRPPSSPPRFSTADSSVSKMLPMRPPQLPQLLPRFSTAPLSVSRISPIRPPSSPPRFSTADSSVSRILPIRPP